MTDVAVIQVGANGLTTTGTITPEDPSATFYDISAGDWIVRDGERLQVQSIKVIEQSGKKRG